MNIINFHRFPKHKPSCDCQLCNMDYPEYMEWQSEEAQLDNNYQEQLHQALGKGNTNDNI